MRSIRKVLLRSLAIVAFAGLTIGSTGALSSADSGLDTGAGGLGYQGATESIENSTGAGAGGSTDTVTTPDTGPSYRGSDVDSNTGSGTGGSTDTGTTWGSGTGGSTDSDKDMDTRGTTRGGVTYPDYSDTLGVSGDSYYDK